MVFIVALPIFVAVGLLAYTGLSAVFSDERKVSRRLTELSSYEASQAAAAHPVLQPFSERILKAGARRLRDEVTQLTPSDARERMRKRIVLAGSPRGVDVDRIVMAKYLCALGLGALFTGLAVLRDAPALTWIMLVAVSVISFWLPDLWLTHTIDDRQQRMRRELPDMLDMLTISVEAGLGFDQAVSKIVGTTSGALAQEFSRALQEIQAGTERTVALRNLEQRAPIAELSAFITAIVQAEKLGVPIGNILRAQAGDMRLMRRQRAEERAQKTPVKIVFPLILCILPATLIVIMGPAVVSIGHVFGAW